MLSMRHSWLFTLAFSLLVGSGCSHSASSDTAGTTKEQGHDDHHEHHHGPETLNEALAELTELRNVIRDAFAKDDPDTAHGPLHEVGEILEAIPELAEKENVSVENQAAAKTAVDALMDAFGSVDKTMHGQEGATYSEVSSKIDTTLAALTAACATDAVTDAAPSASEKGNEKPADAGRP